jgi:hypothetical protein
MKTTLLFLALAMSFLSVAQNAIVWHNVDSLYGPLPNSMHVYYTSQPIDTAAFRAFYLIADLKDKHLDFTTDTTLNRRLTPTKFFEKNASPLVVVNGTFFSFETNRNLNVVVKDGQTVSYNIKSVKQKIGDTITEVAVYRSAIGINKKRKADVAWIKTDSAIRKVLASQLPVNYKQGNFWQKRKSNGEEIRQSSIDLDENYKRWKVQTAIGGGPVLLQNGIIQITNEFEKMFTGKAINDKHPRTAMGYTKDNKLIILVVEGRNKVAGGATLTQEAQILKDLGCVEALNLDGGGSSCLLINGKETIKPSDKEGQRSVPAIFIIKAKN